MAEGKNVTTYRVKEKYVKNFDFSTFLLYCLIPIVGIIIGAIVCKEKYYIILELETPKEYVIKKVLVKELDLFTVEVNEQIEERTEGADYEYWAIKKDKKVLIRSIRVEEN